MKALGWVLVALATFMFVGYLGADVAGAEAIAALIITVLLPGAAGAALISGRLGTRSRLDARREALRRQTLEAELLRLARRHAARLTVVEVVSELAVSPDEAKEALDALAVRGLADFEVTDSGVVVYVFHDVRHIEDKHDSRGLLE
ncbi:MAG: hypothetical protein FJ207_00250 [Gemmatimonadetes bacterium]|nr:hypothetical protein [Gemmatimonadota bacterium]